jgi:hypothetical protein
MKHLICLLLIALLLTGCAAPEAEEAQQPTPTAVVTAVPTATPAPTPTYDEEPAELTMFLEGDEYTVTGFRYTSHLGYSMVYDPDWVRPEQHAGYDHYTAVTEVHVPELYLRVTKADGTMEQVLSNLTAQGAEQVGTSLFGGCYGVQLSKMSGLGSSDTVVNYYVTQAGEAVYVLESSYFWEVAEGVGARIWYMLDTIRFTDAPAATELRLMFRDREIKDFTSAVGEVTYIALRSDEGGYLEKAEWTVDNEDVCELYADNTGCYIEIKAAGTAKVTARCGDLERSVIVRGIEAWK